MNSVTNEESKIKNLPIVYYLYNIPRLDLTLVIIIIYCIEVTLFYNKNS